MATYIKLINKQTGHTVNVRNKEDTYLTPHGIEYLGAYAWRHAYVHIPSSRVQSQFRSKYEVYGIITEDMYVGHIAEYRRNFPTSLIAVRSGKHLLYHGVPEYLPKELANLVVQKSEYIGQCSVLFV